MSSSYSSSYSYSSSSSSTSSNGGPPTTTGFQASHQAHTDSSGTTSERATYQNLGEAPQEFSRQTNAQGQELVGGAGNKSGRITSGGESGPRVTDVTDEEADANAKKYEEAMEDEYAKREGGA